MARGGDGEEDGREAVDEPLVQRVAPRGERGGKLGVRAGGVGGRVWVRVGRDGVVEGFGDLGRGGCLGGWEEDTGTYSRRSVVLDRGGESLFNVFKLRSSISSILAGRRACVQELLREGMSVREIELTRGRYTEDSFESVLG